MALPLTLLVIDDSPADQALAYEAFLELAPECEVRLVGSGEEALSVLRDPARTLPDVILLDVNMPGLNGFDVLRALKHDPRLTTLPVVMLTTSNNRADISQAYALRASSYLVKAPTFAAFLQQVEAFLTYWRTACIPAHT